jgi:hypothetical protein
VNFIAIDSILVQHVRNVLLKQKSVFRIEKPYEGFLGSLSFSNISVDNVWVSDFLSLSLLFSFVLLNEGLNCGSFQNVIVLDKFLVLELSTDNAEDFFLFEFQMVMTMIFEKGISEILSCLTLRFDHGVEFFVVKVLNLIFGSGILVGDSS